MARIHWNETEGGLAAPAAVVRNAAGEILDVLWVDTDADLYAMVLKDDGGRVVADAAGDPAVAVRSGRVSIEWTGDIPAGYYRHFKGGLYVAAGLARPSEGGSDFQVVYFSLAKARWNVRPLYSPPGTPADARHGWLEPVEKTDYRGPRFRFIAPVLPIMTLENIEALAAVR